MELYLLIDGLVEVLIKNIIILVILLYLMWNNKDYLILIILSLLFIYIVKKLFCFFIWNMFKI